MAFKDWKTFKKAWVKALRSGKYMQGQERLVDSDDCFCCLGVAANLLVEAGNKGEWINTHSFGWAFGKSEDDSDSAVLTASGACPVWLKNKLCTFSEEEGQDYEETLMGMNDRGRTFEELASYIEKNL